MHPVSKQIRYSKHGGLSGRYGRCGQCGQCGPKIKTYFLVHVVHNVHIVQNVHNDFKILAVEAGLFQPFFLFDFSNGF